MNLYEQGQEAYLKAYGRFPVVFKEGKGVYLYSTDNEKYLDFFSGIGVNSLGYGHPTYTQALEDQLHKMIHLSNYFYSDISITAARKLKEATQLDGGVFFCNSGAEAVEGALKLARKYYYLKTNQEDGQIIAFNHSFHGRTTGALKLTCNAHYQQGFGPLIDGVHYATLNDIESVKALINEKTCAIIVEPVQGEGGVIPCEYDFLQEIRKLCDEKDICLILDEVQCGMGRTGTIMTYFQYDILPDIVCLAKGLGCGVPVGAFVANKKVGQALVPGDHGSTYGGNPLVTRAVSTVFEIIENEKLLDHVKEMSEYLIEKLDEIVESKEIVDSRRGLGLMQGLVLKTEAKPYIKALLDHHIICVSAGTNVIRMLPPFIVTEAQIDEFIEVLNKIL